MASPGSLHIHRAAVSIPGDDGRSLDSIRTNGAKASTCNPVRYGLLRGDKVHAVLTKRLREGSDGQPRGRHPKIANTSIQLAKLRTVCPGCGSTNSIVVRAEGIGGGAAGDMHVGSAGNTHFSM